jgi:hypothetical protein
MVKVIEAIPEEYSEEEDDPVLKRRHFDVAPLNLDMTNLLMEEDCIRERRPSSAGETLSPMTKHEEVDMDYVTPSRINSQDETRSERSPTKIIATKMLKSTFPGHHFSIKVTKDQDSLEDRHNSHRKLEPWLNEATSLPLTTKSSNKNLLGVDDISVCSED